MRTHCTDQRDLDGTAPEVILGVLWWPRVARSGRRFSSVLLVPLAARDVGLQNRRVACCWCLVDRSDVKGPSTRCSGLLALWRDPDPWRRPMARALCRSLPRRTRWRLANPSSDPRIVIDLQQVERAAGDWLLTLRQPGRTRG